MSGLIPLFKVFMAPEINAELAPTLASGYITQGPQVDRFEQALKDYLGYDFGFTVNSATSGLMMALRLAGVEPGDTVISTPMTCSATNEAIALMGADIVWADVDRYGNIDPTYIEKHLLTSTLAKAGAKAIMTVDWGGLPCDYEFLKSFGIPVIEDAAHAFGATYCGRSISQNGGDVVVYSFQAIKHLTCGDGGLVVTHNEMVHERGKLLRWYGLDRDSSDAMRSRQDIHELGWKFNMNDISASIGLANLPSMDWVLDRHLKNAAYYDDVLRDFRPDWPADRVSSSWVYTIRVHDPLEFEAFAKDNGFIASQVHRRNDEYSVFAKYQGDILLGLDDFASQMVCIPVGWWLTQEDLELIAAVVLLWESKQ